MSDSASKLPSAAAQHVPCKVCNTDSPLLGVVDFSRSCEDVTHKAAPLTGIPIYYHRCPSCGFIFTTAFDNFTSADFAYWIYNDRYVEADHDYFDFRPRYNAQVLTQMFGARKDVPILDYGGGTGKLAETLRAGGFSRVDVYDPFVDQFSVRPQERYPLVVAFEVVEHSTRPREVFADMVSLTAPGGLTIVSTRLQPWDIDRLGVQWWYASPRNGHVSLHSQKSLQILATEHGLRVRSDPSRTWHMLGGEIPDFAQHMKFPHG
jgi:hypothetical protein